MRAEFAQYSLSKGQRKIVESLESCGLQFERHETVNITNEESFNKLIEHQVQHIRDSAEELASGIERQLYETRTEGPYKPYPAERAANG
jgi:hypothetical protein